tara:strand:+ start:3290 stop:3931 length:642 start_codon:yes stop_codon:yes gene_type:complete
MAKKLLQEYFQLCPDGLCAVETLTETEIKNMDNGSVYLVGVCQKAGTKNGNGRIYKKETLQREIDAYQKAIREKRALGELDHPDDSVINLKNASHLVTKMWWKGDDVMGKIEVLDTPSGNVLKALLNSGVKLGISSRGLGSVSESNGVTMVEDDFQLICFDIVSEPSTPGAYLNPTMSDPKVADLNLYINEQKDKSKKDIINETLDDILGDNI